MADRQDRLDNQQSRGATGKDYVAPILETPFTDSDQRAQNEEARAAYDNGKAVTEANEKNK